MSSYIAEGYNEGSFTALTLMQGLKDPGKGKFVEFHSSLKGVRKLKVVSLQSAQQTFNEQKFTKEVLFSTERSNGIVFNFLPGQELPPHRHPGREVVITVLQGSGSGRLGEESFTFSEQDTFHCTGEEELSITNNGETPLSIYVLLYKI